MTDAGTCAKDSKGVTLTCAQFNGCIPHATPTLFTGPNFTAPMNAAFTISCNYTAPETLLHYISK
jgi:hypothetical protein